MIGRRGLVSDVGLQGVCPLLPMSRHQWLWEAEIWHKCLLPRLEQTVDSPFVSQREREISCDVCDTGALGPSGLGQQCKLSIWRETKKPEGAPWWRALYSVRRCREKSGLGKLGTLKGAEYGSQDTPELPSYVPPLPTLHLAHSQGSSNVNGLIPEAKTGSWAGALGQEQAGGLASPLQLSGSLRACQLDKTSLSPVLRGEG